MSFHSDFSSYINSFFSSCYPGFNCSIDVHEASKNEPNKDEEPKYLIDSKYSRISAVNMDAVAKAYKKYRGVPCNPLNSVDAFLIDSDNVWYFIEFKDCKIGSSKKDNVEKKALNNILMIIDIFKRSAHYENVAFDNDDPLFFIKNNCVFILVAAESENSELSTRVHDCCCVLDEKYTPDYLEKLKYYYFKDAYAYTENYFEEFFLDKFKY